MGGTLNLSDVTFTGGNVTNTGGGVIFTNSGIILNNTNAGTLAFTNNSTTTGNGGAILGLGTGAISIGNAGGTITMTGNSAGTAGGAIAITASGGVTINGSAITLASNSAQFGGGGAIDSSGPVSIGNAGSTVSMTGNIAGKDGGAINAVGAVTINGSLITLTGNTGQFGAGGAIVAGGDISIGNAGTTNTVTVTGNTAGDGDGGAISSVAGSVTINGSQITVTDNHATAGSAGAINAAGDVSIGNASSMVTLSGNTATSGSGGAINSASATTIMGGTITLTGNSAGTSGGAINSGATVTINGSASGTVALSSNTATSGSGGAINSAGATTIVGGTITLSGNQAATSGGGVSAVGDVTITGNLTADSNAALNGNGGAINAAVTGNVVVTGSLSGHDNHATSDGGAIFAGEKVTVTGGVELENNTASFGGAISGALGGVSLATASGNTTLSDNTASTGRGGAVFTISDITIGDPVTNPSGTVTISGNRAGTDGGALETNGGNVFITGMGSINSNSAGGNGGAIATSTRVAGNVTLVASGGDLAVTGNSAGGNGGAIYLNQGVLDLEATAGNITFSSNTESTSGVARANAIYLNNANGATTATFNAAAGHSVTFFDPIQNNAANGLITVTKTGAGAVVFDGSLYTNSIDQLSQVYANTTVQAGTFAVQNNAVYGALAADVGQTTASSFTVDAGSTLAGGIAGEVRADDFALNGTLNIAGAAPPGNASGGFSTFTVTSNDVSFGAGSEVRFNTYLNEASTQLTDLLTLNLNGSATSGTANIFVTNVGGPGGLTTNNGIELVHVTNNDGTTAGAFTLANPELRGGAHDYRLFQGGLNGSDPNNWYLRSTFVVEPPGPPPPEPPPPVTPPEVLPPEPPGPGPGTFPIIGPEIATYGVVQPMAQQLGRAMLGSHDERLGDLYRVSCEPSESNASPYTKAPVYTKAPAGCAYGWRPAVWGRLFGQQVDNHYQAFADPRADGQIAGLQAGVDVLRSDSLFAGHQDYAGFYAAYGNANVEVSGLVTNAAATGYVLQHTGRLNLNAYSGGVYWTHYGVPGWYIDLTLQGTSYGGAASTEFARLNTNGSGFISSLEGGYPIALPVFGPGFVLEPQAQVLWQWVSFDSGNDGLGPVALGTSSGTTARVGLKGKWTITTDGGQAWQPYVRANYWSDFGGNPTTLFATESVPLISHAQYMDVDAGFTTKIDTHLSAFAEAGYQFAVSNDGGGKRDGVKGTAGLRYQW